MTRSRTRNGLGHSPRTSVAVVLVALTVMVSACGQSTDPVRPATPSPATASPTPPPTARPEPTATPRATPTPTPEPTATPEPAPAGLRPAVAGHNRIDADRINLVLAPFGWDDPDAFATVATWFVGWDGTARLIDPDGKPAEPDDAVTAQLGLFGIEPFRSNRDRFNVWLTDESPDTPAGWTNAPGPFPDLVNKAIVVLVRDPDIEGFNSHSGQDVAVLTPDQLGTGGDDPFANAVVVVHSSYPAGTMLDLPHELGHALFGLADEYVGRLAPDGVARIDFWPSCAASRDVAEQWWGDLVGQYDPMIDVWADEMTRAGFGDQVGDLEYLREQVTTAYVAGGCFGIEGSYRSAEDTMMGFSLPAFGLTNRRWAEQVLGQYSGE